MKEQFIRLTRRVHDRWLDIHPIWRVLIVSGIVALAVGPTVTGAFLRWQAERMIAEASEALKSNRPTEARQLAARVLEDGLADGRARPILVRALDQLNASPRGNVALDLLADSKASPADRRFAWQVACRAASTWLVLATWESLSKQERADAGYLLALVDRLMADGMMDEAREMLDQGAQPPETELLVRRLRIIAADGEADSFAEVQREWVAAVDRHPDAIERLWVVLDEIPQSALEMETAARLLQHAEKTRSSEPVQALRQVRLEMAVAPDQKDELFRAAIREFGSSAPLATIRWCLQIDQLEAADELVRGLPVEEDPESFELACEVAEHTGQLEMWADLLASPPAEANRAETHCDRAYVAYLREDASQRALAETQALDAARIVTDDGAWVRLARRAEFRGLLDLSRRAWMEAIRARSGPLPLSARIEPLFEYYQSLGKEAEIDQILATYRLVEPGDPLVHARLAYLSCLTGRMAPAVVIAELESVRQKFPDLQSVRPPLALAYLLDSRADDASALVAQAPPEVLESHPGLYAICGIALLMSGRPEDAAPWLDAVPWNDLLPSERRVFRETLASPSLKRFARGSASNGNAATRGVAPRTNDGGG